jgi:hypothetical protein
MSRPRRAASQPATLPPNIRSGLASICEGNEALIKQMLGAEATGRADATLTDQLAQVMAVNSLSAEMMLARFFDASVLSSYASARLGKSGTGSAATLAARIAREWSKPTFSLGEAPSETMEHMPEPPAQASTWSAPTWLELQTDSDDDEEEALRKKRLKAEIRSKAKAAKAAAASPKEAADAQGEGGHAPSELSSKRRKLDAAETATVLSRAAFEAEGDEAPVAFNAEHYGELGLNGKFEMEDAVQFFAGSEEGGGGMFENQETRTLAACPTQPEAPPFHDPYRRARTSGLHQGTLPRTRLP